jgi:hypothetical protein
MAAKFFTGIPLDGPDPECVGGEAQAALLAATAVVPKPMMDHSKPSRPAPTGQPERVPVTLARR